MESIWLPARTVSKGFQMKLRRFVSPSPCSRSSSWPTNVTWRRSASCLRRTRWVNRQRINFPLRMAEVNKHVSSGFVHGFSSQKVFADLTAEGISVIETSTLTEEGVMQVKSEVRPRTSGSLRVREGCCMEGVVVDSWPCASQACDRLLAHRVDSKMKGKKVHDVLNRLHLAMPAKRDEKVITAARVLGRLSWRCSWLFGLSRTFVFSFPLSLPGQASVYPWGSVDAQEGDGGGRTQTQTGMSGVDFESKGD